MFNNKSIKDYLFWLLLSILFLAGGLGYSNIWISWSGVVISSFFLILFYFEYEKIYFPKHFKYLSIFLTLFSVSLFWSEVPLNSFSYLITYLGGGLVYLLFYNLKKISKAWPKSTLVDKDINEKITNGLIILGIAFALWVVAEKILNIDKVGSFGLIRFAAASKNHHHLGDYWVIVALISFYKYFSKKTEKYIWISLTIISLAALYLSRSRSAILAVVIGLIFLFSKSKKFQIYKNYFYSLLGLLVIVLLILGGAKGILFEREYFIQAILGFIKNPFGIGYGNFDLISGKPEYTILGLKSFSSVTHNMILEIMVGMGVFGISFLIWFYKILKDLLKDVEDSNILFKTIFLGLSINFMFDFTYIIPTMLYIWFISLGLSEK